MAQLLGLEDNVKCWDLAETAGGGPFPALLDSEIVVNCIYLGNNKMPPFLAKEHISGAPNRKLEVLCDVSCDFTNPNNPFPSNLVLFVGLSQL
jgi:saccharopine dehydrogenase (NAD+, L-lysine forming)